MKNGTRIGTLCIASVLFLGLLESLRELGTEQQESLSSLEIVHAAAVPERIPAAHASTVLAATPPLGWNSWDGYGTTINEEQVKANAKWFAEHLKPAGWQYVVVDMEWFVTNPTPEGNSKTSLYSLDANGRYTPALNRFPSAANEKGFKPLGDYIHSLGLKFGIHILRGIPKKAVDANLPIAGSNLHADDAADISESCPWNPDNYGIDATKPGAQPYYDSIFSMYASWGVDVVKVDCISSRPYRGHEIRLISNAIAKTSRPMALSLSPGPAPIEKIEEMRKYAQMWRVSNDIWDLWHSDVEYPQGLGDQFPNAIRWAGRSQPGHWPDLDMLPLGYLGPAPGWGQPRLTRLSHGERRTLMALWSIFPSPLMIGGDLTKADEWTLSLLTNREVLEVDQHSKANHVAISSNKRAIWLADSASKDTYYLAVFNRGEAKDEFRYSWKELGLSQNSYATRDLWEHKDLGTATELLVTLQPHESVLYKLQPAAGRP
jgi:alpha-galactosidase